MEEIKLKLSPKYNFIYELKMPTGRKTKKACISIFITLIILVIVNIFFKYMYQNIDEINIKKIFNVCIIIFLLFLIIKLIVTIVLQILQYKNISYNFYKDRLEYKDMFLNQQTKIIKYDSISEIEIRRNVWERINGLGIIIIYTNAEKAKNSGMVIYAVKNVDEIYEKIKLIIDEKDK